MTLWGLCYVEEIVRATVWERRCEKDVVRTTLWERRCEKDVVRETLWERCCEKDVVKKSLWEIYFFWPALFYWQMFVSKNVLPRLGALHRWCLCYILIKGLTNPNGSQTIIFFLYLCSLGFIWSNKRSRKVELKMEREETVLDTFSPGEYFIDNIKLLHRWIGFLTVTVSLNFL